MTETLTIEDVLIDLIDLEEDKLKVATDIREQLIHRLRVADINQSLLCLMYPDAETIVEVQREIIKYLLDGEYCGAHTFLLDDHDKRNG